LGGVLKLKIKIPNFEVMSNIKYVLKTGNPKESARKDKTTKKRYEHVMNPSIGAISEWKYLLLLKLW